MRDIRLCATVSFYCPLFSTQLPPPLLAFHCSSASLWVLHSQQTFEGPSSAISEPANIAQSTAPMTCLSRSHMTCSFPEASFLTHFHCNLLFAGPKIWEHAVFLLRGSCSSLLVTSTRQNTIVEPAHLDARGDRWFSQSYQELPCCEHKSSKAELRNKECHCLIHPLQSAVEMKHLTWKSFKSRWTS